MNNKTKTIDSKLEGPVTIEAECKLYTIFVKRKKFYLYEYNNGKHLDYVLRDAANRIVERHTSDYIEVGKVFTDSCD